MSTPRPTAIYTRGRFEGKWEVFFFFSKSCNSNDLYNKKGYWVAAYNTATPVALFEDIDS